MNMEIDEDIHIYFLKISFIERGEGTVENTVALCPNCHKRMHVLNEERAIRVLQSRNRKV